MAWRSTLKHLLALSAQDDSLKEIRWAIIGSVATALQGCIVSPNDIDILVDEPQGVYGFANILSSYAPPTCDYQPGDEAWQSSQSLLVSADSEPDAYGYMWHFCRFSINGVKVEVAHITPPSDLKTAKDGGGIWEAGPEVWSYVQKQTYQNHEVLVAPLEIQLETNLQRELNERTSEIVRVMKEQGYDKALLKKSISEKNREKVEALLIHGTE